MKIAIDMDNTLVDEMGSKERPGIKEFLDTLSAGHTLYVWTNSTRARALYILGHHHLRKYFDGVIAREDYDPGEKGLRKDLRIYGFDILIDDDPEEIYYTIKSKKTGILVDSYRKHKKMDPRELDTILEKYRLG